VSRIQKQLFALFINIQSAVVYSISKVLSASMNAEHKLSSLVQKRYYTMRKYPLELRQDPAPQRFFKEAG
jgi:hypothetical protein